MGNASKKDLHNKLGSTKSPGGVANFSGSKIIRRAESFSSWLGNRLALESKGGSQPVVMPKETSSKVEFRDAKERIPGGRRNTTMDSRPKRLRTRGARKRDAMRRQDS